MKGRLLNNQLQMDDIKASSLLIQFFMQQPNSLINNEMILPVMDETTTYSHLLKILEIMMYIERNKLQITTLSNHDIHVALLKFQKEAIKLLSTPVQSKIYPSKITEFDYDIVFMNYSDQTMNEDALDTSLIRNYYHLFNQSPLLLKCGEKIYCYGTIEKKEDNTLIKSEKITELNKDKFKYSCFPEKKMHPILLNKKFVLEKIQNEIRKKQAHIHYDDYIYNKTVYYYITECRKICLSDNISEMLLLGFLRIIDSLTVEEKNNLHIKHIIQLIKNSRHAWLPFVDTCSALHIRKSVDGTEYESTNNDKTWLGLIKVLNYVFHDANIRNSKIGQLFINYLQFLRDDNLFYLHKENNSTLKDTIKGVIRNRDGIYTIEQIQYLPNKKMKPQSHTSIIMQELLEMMMDNLSFSYYGNLSTWGKAKYISSNNKKECILSIPIIEKIRGEINKKEITYKDFNITTLLKGHPLAHEINLSAKYNRLILSAMFGCNLYLLFFSQKNMINTYVKCNKIDSNSLVILCNGKSKHQQKNNIDQANLYYVTFDKKIEKLSFKEVISNKINTKISKQINSAMWCKDLINHHALIFLNNKSEGEQKKLFTLIEILLAKNKIIFLNQILTVAGSKKAFDVIHNNELYKQLSYTDMAAITLYTTAYYKVLQPFLRNDGVLPKETFIYNPSAKDPNIYALKYSEKLGKDFEKNPYLLYKFTRDLLIYNYCINHGISRIIQNNQNFLLKSIKRDFNFSNCNLYILSDKEEIEKCKAANKGHGIILYREKKTKIIYLYHCINQYFVKKIMDIDLVVVLNEEDFLRNFSKKNYYSKLIDLTLVNRKNYLTIPKTNYEIKLVNKFIHYSMWYCQLNTLDKKIYRGDLESFYVDLIRPKLIDRIITDGVFFSSANEYTSASLGVCKSFLNLDGWRVLTVIHIPKSFISLIMNLSDVGNELEVLFGPNMRLIYYKVEKNASFKNIIYHAIMTDYDFDINDSKWNKMISAQFKSEIYTNIEFIKNDIKINEIKIPFLLTTQPFAIQSNNALEKIKSYLISKKYTPLFKLSCMEGTSLEIVYHPHQNDIFYIENYIRDHDIKNTYLIATKRNNQALMHFKLYYVKDQNTINKILVYDYSRKEAITISNQLNNLSRHLFLTKKTRLNAKNIWSKEIIYDLEKLIGERKDSSLPFILGMRDIFNYTEKKDNHTKINFLTKSWRHSIAGSMQATTNSVEEKINELHCLLAQNQRSHEELEKNQKELTLIKTEEAARSLQDHSFIYRKFHDIKINSIINLANQFIKIIKNIITHKNSYNFLSNDFLINIQRIIYIKKYLEHDKKDILLDKIKENVKYLSTLTIFIAPRSKYEVINWLHNKIDIAMLVFLHAQLYDNYPLKMKNWINEIPNIIGFKNCISFENIYNIIKIHTEVEIKDGLLENNIQIDRQLFSDINNHYLQFIDQYPYLKNHTTIKIIKKIIFILNLRQIDLSILTEYYTELFDIVNYYDYSDNNKPFIFTQEETDFKLIIQFIKKIFETIELNNHISPLTGSDIIDINKKASILNKSSHSNIRMSKLEKFSFFSKSSDTLLTVINKKPEKNESLLSYY